MVKLLSPSMQRDFGMQPVLLASQDSLLGHSAVVQQSLQLGQLLVDEAPERRGDFDVSAGEFEAHVSALSSQPINTRCGSTRVSEISRAPCAGSKWESTVLRGTSRSFAEPASSLRAEGC